MFFFSSRKEYTYESHNKDLLKIFDIEHGQEGNNCFANINLKCYKNTEKISITIIRINYYNAENLTVYYKIFFHNP